LLVPSIIKRLSPELFKNCKALLAKPETPELILIPLVSDEFAICNAVLFDDETKWSKLDGELIPRPNLSVLASQKNLAVVPVSS